MNSHSLFSILSVSLMFSAQVGLAAPKKKAPSAKPAASVLKLDTAASQLGWHGSKVTGAHEGTVKLKGGNLNIADGQIAGGAFEIDLASIANTDVQDAGYRGKLENHLKSEDFFDVAKYPTAVFKLTSVKPIAGAAAGQPNHEVTGDLTIRGKTNPVTFPAVVTLNGEEAQAQGTVKLDRTRWDVRYGSGKFFQGLGDKLIHDEFSIQLNLVAKK